MTNTEQKEVLELYDKGTSVTEIMKATGKSKSAIYTLIRKLRGTTTRTGTMTEAFQAAPKIGIGDVKAFKETLKVGDTFQMIRYEEDEERRHIPVPFTVKIKALYPFVADCDKGSYTYYDLMMAQKEVTA